MHSRPTVSVICKEITRLLQQLNLTITTAESATGGRIADCLTNIPGSSEFFLGSIVAYDNRVKTLLLNVPPSTIHSSGAVSKDTAIAMSQGVRTLLDSDVSISTTGIAGPTGGTPGKPVGLLYAAVSSNKRTTCERFILHGSRAANKKAFTLVSLSLLKKHLLEMI